jgi:hypothetical protein
MKGGRKKRVSEHNGEIAGFWRKLGQEEMVYSDDQYHRNITPLGLTPSEVRQHYFFYRHGIEVSREAFYESLEQYWEKAVDFLYDHPFDNKPQIEEADLCVPELDDCLERSCYERHELVCATCGIEHDFGIPIPTKATIHAKVYSPFQLILTGEPISRYELVRSWERKATIAQRNAVEVLRRVRSLQRMLFVGKPIYNGSGPVQYFPATFEDQAHWGGLAIMFDPVGRLNSAQTFQKFISHYSCLLRAVSNMDFFGLYWKSAQRGAEHYQRQSKMKDKAVAARKYAQKTRQNIIRKHAPGYLAQGLKPQAVAKKLYEQHSFACIFDRHWPVNTIAKDIRKLINCGNLRVKT